MPKDKSPSRSKVRIFYAEIDGNDDAVDALVQAFSRATQQPQVRIIKSISNRKDAATDDTDETDEYAPEMVDAENTDDEEQAGGPAVRRPRKKPTYQIVKGLNLRPEGKQSLKDFFAEKKPGDNQEIVTVMIYYLEKIAECKGIGVNHIYTGYKEVGVKVPGDLQKAASNAGQRKGWVNTSDGNSMKVEVAGENFVEHDLPRPAPAAK